MQLRYLKLEIFLVFSYRPWIQTNLVLNSIEKVKPGFFFKCSDRWNVRNCSSSHVQVFRCRWNVQIGDGWNVRNCLNMNFLNLVEIWIWILQNLRCLSCKSTNFVLNPRWCRCFGCLGCVCLVCCLLCVMDKIGLYTLSLRYEYP